MTMNNEVQNIQLPDIEGAMSNHNVDWSVSDDCELEDICTTSFTVVDNKSPTPFCVSLFSIVYDDYELMVYAEDFNVGVFDNCTDNEDIRISFSKDSIVPTRLITCDDTKTPYVEVKVYFWDDSDNIEFCTVFLTVIPGMVDCFGDGLIDGVVKSWQGDPLEGVEIILDAIAVEYPKSTLTDAEGRYSFGYHYGNLDYTLSASFDNDYLPGLSTYDLVFIVRHLLGVQPFTNPYKIIAADINGDKTLDAIDLFRLRKLILGVITDVPTNPSWNFLRADYEFFNPLNPLPELLNSTAEPYRYKFNEIRVTGYDFIGVKTGDINN
jgi:hypothetical protein